MKNYFLLILIYNLLITLVNNQNDIYQCYSYDNGNAFSEEVCSPDGQSIFNKDIDKTSAKNKYVENLNNDLSYLSTFKSKLYMPSSSEAVQASKFLSQIKSSTLDDFKYLNQENVEKPKISQISKFNNQIAPRIQSIVQMDYFRFVKFNLNRKCTLWSDNSKCSLKDCSVKLCDQSNLINSILDDEQSYLNNNNNDDNNNNNDNNKNKDVNKNHDDCPDDSPKKLSAINNTVSSENIETMNTLFECSEHDHNGAQYVDLLLNPERYTGYSGESANRIWRSIYEENCFLKKQKNSLFSLDSMCYEERLFYRSISGLHTSINIHLCAHYHIMDGNFGSNPKEFIKRFYGKEEYMKNLFFLYLIELCAIHKSQHYLLNKVNWKSISNQSSTKEAVKDLLHTLRDFKWHFNESVLFKNQPPTVAEEFSHHFKNITTNIMDCVACDKCKLWGKVQTHGLGTAFKILLTKNIEQLNLNRHEIICLFNGLARLSNSIMQLENFTKLINN